MLPREAREARGGEAVAGNEERPGDGTGEGEEEEEGEEGTRVDDCKFKLRAFSVSFSPQRSRGGAEFRSPYNTTAICEFGSSLFVDLSH